MIVRDMRAILWPLDDASQSWNYRIGDGTGAIITYRFLDADGLVEEDAPTSEKPRVLTESQKEVFRDGFEQFEAATNLRFVEVDPDAEAMIGIHNAQRPGALGYTEYFPNFNAEPDSMLLVIKHRQGTYSTLDEETVLHEIGHTLGLDHPFDGPFNLPDRLDNTDVTIMAYEPGTEPALSLRDMDIAALQSIFGTGTSAGSAEIETTGTGEDLVVRIALGAGDDAVSTPWHDSRLAGGAGADALWGRHGQDTILGEAGNDTIDGGKGGDRLFGQRDQDLLQGNNGRDILRGGDGADTLAGGRGADTLLGGRGADTFLFAASDVGKRDVLRDFDPDADVLSFGEGLFAQSASAETLNNGTRLTVPSDDGNLILVLHGVTPEEVEAALGLGVA